MAKTAGTYTAKLSRAPRGLLIPLIYVTLAACGSSGGTTAVTPVVPPSVFVSCDSGTIARDGTRYTDPYGAPKCLAHLFAEVDNLKASGGIPSDARGVAFIYDYFYDFQDEDELSRFVREGGFDGNGNYFLTNADHARLHTNSHGARVRGVYTTISAVLPAGVISRLPRSGYSAEQFRRAYTAARNDNPLVTGSTASSPYATHRAIYNYSLSGAWDLFYRTVTDLTHLSAFTATNKFSEIPTGLIGVASTGNSDANWNIGFRKEPTALIPAGYFVDNFRNSTIAARIDDRVEVGVLDGEYWDSVEVDTDLTDLIANTTTAQLSVLIDHNSWETPTGLISSAFPSISDSLATKVGEAGQTRLRTSQGRQISLLDLLAGATVHSRTGHFYSATYLNIAGNATDFNTPCGVLRDACFILPSLRTASGGPTGSSLAAPRLTAVIDTLWLVWPNLSHLDLHRLLSTCASDLGDPGVDSVFGQGLLDLECLVQPSGGLRIPTAQVAGISGSLIGPSTADTGLATQDDFGRHFDYTAVQTQPIARAFNPLESAHVYTPSQSTVLAVEQDSASAWISYSLIGDLSMSLGAVYEHDSLLGTYGTGHFQIQDGYSSGARLDWIHRLSSTWNTRMHVAYYKGTAQAVHPGALSALRLRQSSVSLSLERQLTYNDMATSRLQVSFSCNTGTRGSFNSFGTPVTLSGRQNCEQRLGVALHF